MPNVSPRATCIEMPFSAVTWPNALTIFSARIAAGKLIMGRSRPAPPAGQMDVGYHRDQYRGADDDVEHEGVDALQRKPVLQYAEHDAADEAADDRAGAARDRGATDDARCDAEEHDVAAAREGIGRADAEGLHQAGEAA